MAAVWSRAAVIGRIPGFVWSGSEGGAAQAGRRAGHQLAAVVVRAAAIVGLDGGRQHDGENRLQDHVTVWPWPSVFDAP